MPRASFDAELQRSHCMMSPGTSQYRLHGYHSLIWITPSKIKITCVLDVLGLLKLLQRARNFMEGNFLVGSEHYLRYPMTKRALSPQRPGLVSDLGEHEIEDARHRTRT